MSATSGGVTAATGQVGPQTYVRPPLSQPEKYERLAFTFCRMGTVGLIAWAVFDILRQPLRPRGGSG